MFTTLSKGKFVSLPSRIYGKNSHSYAVNSLTLSSTIPSSATIRRSSTNTSSSLSLSLSSSFRNRTVVSSPFTATDVQRSMMSTYANAKEYLASLEPQAILPEGFRVSTHSFNFHPAEIPSRTARMTMTLIALDKPTDKFAAMFTSNTFPGAPVLVGRKRLQQSTAVQAIVINNKISNVCAPGGVQDSENICQEVAKHLNLPSADYVIPSSTGIIGWKLPVADMLQAVPNVVKSLQSKSVLPAAHGICTTDLYAKVRSVEIPGTNGGRIVGIAKGAGMIEPNLATMLVYILTDVAIPKDVLRTILPKVINGTFNALSIDSDQSTSDTLVCLSSGTKAISSTNYKDFEQGLLTVCSKLSEDVVRNGEGVQHVMKVKVTGAPTEALARAVGKSIINSPLFKCAVAGNDPNVGRLVCAIGKCVGVHPDGGKHLDMSKTTLHMGGLKIFSEGQFRLTPDVEGKLVKHLKEAQLWESQPHINGKAKPVNGSIGAAEGYALRAEDVAYHTPISYPPHERMVEIDVELGLGNKSMTVLGSDLTHEYVSVNADYRS